MPKIVDHNQRRAEIVRVIIKVISAEGLRGTTVRSISRAGGFSGGVLAHYFSNKDEMIKFAFGGVADMVFERIDRRLKTAKGIERVRIILEEHLPIDEHDDETAVALAFWEVALHDADLRGQYKANYGRWREYLRREIGANAYGMTTEELEARVDLAIAATDGLLVTFALDGGEYKKRRRQALVDGLMVMLALEERRDSAA